MPRIVCLNNVFYEIRGDIIQRALNPWMAKVSSGATTYQDFSQANLEEYHDFRNGIGLKRGMGSDARLDWSEGIDFTIGGQGVLGPLVTMAGNFGVAPIKIIDFKGNTYAIGSDGTIKKWNVLASEWEYCQYLIVEDCEDIWDLYRNPNATHALDTTDYKVGSGAEKITINTSTVNQMLAEEAISSVDLSAYNRIRAWVKSELATASGDLQFHLGPVGTPTWTSPTGFSDPSAEWSDETLAYDEDITTRAFTTQGTSDQTWSAYLHLTVASMLSDTVRYYLASAAPSCDIEIYVYRDGGWVGVFTGAAIKGSWQEKTFAPGLVTEVRLRFKNTTGGTIAMDLYEFDFGKVSTQAIDIPALTADTWTRVVMNIPTPADLTAVTKVGIKSITDLGVEPYTIRVDDIQAEKTEIILPSPVDAIVAIDATAEYFVVSSATAAKYSTDAITWSTLTGCMGYLAWYAAKLRAIATTGNTLHSSAANDIDGTWTSFALTGDFGTVYSLFEGKLLADGTPALYFVGNRGLYSIDVTNEIAYKQEVEYPSLIYSGHKGIYWNGSVWASTGYGIIKVTPSMATYIGPDLDDGLPSSYQGYIYDMETVNNWLVYCVNGGSSDKSSIIKRNSSYGGNLQVYTTAAINKPIACLHHSPSSLYTNGRLWFGEGTDIKYIPFPDTTSNTKQITNYPYIDASGYGSFPIFRKMAVINKVALGIGAITKSCDSSDYINVYYGLNGAEPTTLLGSLKTSPHPAPLTFGNGLGVEFYTIQFAIKLVRGATNTNSPELESLLFYWYAVPDRINSWTFNVIATGENSDIIFNDLETIYDTATLVMFYPSGDKAKDSYRVKLTTMPSREWWENQGRREGVIQITTQEICNL